MITIDGVEYGTAAEVAAELGPDVTEAMVRSWAKPGPRGARLPRHNVPGAGRGTTYFPLEQAAQIEAQKRGSRRGRPRALDMTLVGR